jgi:hypothetical protein
MLMLPHVQPTLPSQAADDMINANEKISHSETI